MAFDKEKAAQVKRFIETLCTHTKGRWAGIPFRILPWQDRLIDDLFGTVKENGLRQYRTCYCEIAKKNGKSELGAAIALYMLCGDGEDGAEVYCAAGDRNQASLVFNVAAQMVRNSKQLSDKLKVVDSQKRIIYYDRGSFMQVLSSEAYTKHGLNPSCIIFDEIHAQPNRELWDVLTEGTDIARSQQLIFTITTAGIADKTTIGWEVANYARQVKDGIIEDPSYLSVIYAADEGDDWESVDVWKKANPSLKGVDSNENYIFEMDNLETHYKQVKENPARLNNFLRFRLNLWVGQVSRYLPMDKWDACKNEFDSEALVKRVCYGGLDLSSSVDLSSFVIVFPPAKEDEKWKALCKFYLPEDAMIERSKKDKVPYDMWVRAGLITTTPGNVIDYSFIRRDINNISELYNLVEVAYDPWGAVKLATELQEEDGISMVEHRQGFKSMSPPTKELLNYTLANKLAHNGNPVLRWNANNLAVKIDAAENVKPEKDKSSDRIDGIVALIMALGRAILAYERKSRYETEGLMVV